MGSRQSFGQASSDSVAGWRSDCAPAAEPGGLAAGARPWPRPGCCCAACCAAALACRGGAPGGVPASGGARSPAPFGAVLEPRQPAPSACRNQPHDYGRRNALLRCRGRRRPCQGTPCSPSDTFFFARRCNATQPGAALPREPGHFPILFFVKTSSISPMQCKRKHERDGLK